MAVPLTGKQGEFLGALLLGSPQAALVAMKNDVAGSAIMVAAAGLVLAFLLSWWVAGRVSRPLARLTEGIAEVASGDWDARVEPGAVPEVGKAILAFNTMTRQLTDDRAGQVARERAAAWRQLAGQLAAELKTLLPPLQKAVEGLALAPQHDHETETVALETHEGDDFADDAEPVLESNVSAARSAEAARLQPVSSAMRQTLEMLAACAGKLGEFASLPVPRLEAVNLNDAVRAAIQSFEPRFSAIGRPPITPELFLDDRVGLLRADPILLRRALDNLLLFVLEDMPAGGTFTIHTRRQDDMAHMILAGSGSGLTAPRGPQQGESRAGMPDNAARVSGIGLSLATVQSIVSSHGGRISIESSPLAGTTFYLDWPVHGIAAPSSIPTFPAVLQNEPAVQPPSQPSSQPASHEDAPQNQQEPVASRTAESVQPAAQPSEPPAAEPAIPLAVELAVETAAPQEAKPQEVNVEAQVQVVPEHSAAEQRAEGMSEAPAQAAIELAVEPTAEVTPMPEPMPASRPMPQLESQGQPQDELHTEPQPEIQLAAVSAAEPVDRELAAVIEEVIETPRSMFRNSQHFVRESDYVEESDELESVDFPMATPASEVPGNLFGVPVPDSATAVDASAAPGNVALPAPAPVAPTFTLAEAESRLDHKPGGADAPTNGNHRPAPEPGGAQTSQQSSTKAPQRHGGDDLGRPLTYSPLTYRW